DADPHLDRRGGRAHRRRARRGPGRGHRRRRGRRGRAVTWARWVDDELADIRAAGRWRSFRSFDALGPVGELPRVGKVVSFASNDYLGLSAHPTVLAAAHEALDRWGTGATASRLVVGNRPVHDELEAALAEWKGTEAALLFPTGYAA